MSQSKCDALPLGYTPRYSDYYKMVERGRFEPPNPLGIDLQSTAFSHFATSPNIVINKMVEVEGLEPTTHAL